jgi:hypothetical protein
VAKPKKDADRRAVVEQMRREQQRKERRRTLLILGSALAVGAVIIGYAVFAAISQSEKDGRDLAALGTPVADAGCQDVTTKAAEGNNDHRPEGEKVFYKEAPPATGPHWGRYLQGTEIRKIYTEDDRPPLERLVHSLEHGHTILWYDETIADDDDAMTELRSIARKFPNNGDLENKFIAAPWTAADGAEFPDDKHVALTHWSMGGTNGNDEGQLGVWQYCSEVSGEAVNDFMADYPAEDSPEPTAP